MSKLNNFFSGGVLFPEFVSIKLMDWSGKENVEHKIMKSRIEEFVKSKKRVSLSEVMDNFGLDLEETTCFIKELREEGRIKEA